MVKFNKTSVFLCEAFVKEMKTRKTWSHNFKKIYGGVPLTFLDDLLQHSNSENLKAIVTV